MYDSVHVFALGLQTLEQSHSLALANVSCDAEQPWDGGLSLINYINSVSSVEFVCVRSFLSTNMWLQHNGSTILSKTKNFKIFFKG